MVLAWENLQWGFCGVDCCSSSLLFFWYWLLFFIHCCFCDVVFHSLLFDVMPHSSVSYHRVFTPILYFQPSSSQRDWHHFHFNLSGPFFHSFIASATVLSGHFLTTFIFYLTLLPTFLWQPAFIKASLGADSSSLKFAGFHSDCWSSKHTRPICLFDSQQSSILIFRRIRI